MCRCNVAASIRGPPVSWYFFLVNKTTDVISFKIVYLNMHRYVFVTFSFQLMFRFRLLLMVNAAMMEAVKEIQGLWAELLGSSTFHTRSTPATPRRCSSASPLVPAFCRASVFLLKDKPPWIQPQSADSAGNCSRKCSSAAPTFTTAALRSPTSITLPNQTASSHFSFLISLLYHSFNSQLRSAVSVITSFSSAVPAGCLLTYALKPSWSGFPKKYLTLSQINGATRNSWFTFNQCLTGHFVPMGANSLCPVQWFTLKLWQGYIQHYNLSLCI